MNELNDENKELKEQLSEQGTQLDFLQDENRHMRTVLEENKELKLQLEAFKDKLCELGVSDVKLYGKRYYTGLEEWLE